MLQRSQLFRHDYRVDEVNLNNINVSQASNVFYPNEVSMLSKNILF